MERKLGVASPAYAQLLCEFAPRASAGQGSPLFPEKQRAGGRPAMLLFSLGTGRDGRARRLLKEQSHE